MVHWCLDTILEVYPKHPGNYVAQHGKRTRISLCHEALDAPKAPHLSCSTLEMMAVRVCMLSCCSHWWVCIDWLGDLFMQTTALLTSVCQDKQAGIDSHLVQGRGEALMLCSPQGVGMRQPGAPWRASTTSSAKTTLCRSSTPTTSLGQPRQEEAPTCHAVL